MNKTAELPNCRTAELNGGEVLDLDARVREFFTAVGRGEIEIYNEFSLQHEFGVYLRSCLSEGNWKVQFERSATFFEIDSSSLPKKEIDISVFTHNLSWKTAIEFKFPRNRQYPEQMFSACKDLAFLEGLISAGFNSGLFVFVADDHLFYRGAAEGLLYSCFRGNNKLCGVIEKPTGRKDERVELRGQYGISWNDAKAVRFWTADIAKTAAAAAG